jgi:hypothetical protein
MLPPPQVDIENSLIVSKIFDVPFCEHRPLMQDCDFRVESADELHIVLDHDHRGRIGQGSDQTGELAPLFPRHSCGWLVKEKNGRRQTKHHADIEPLLLSMRQFAGRSFRLALHCKHAEHLIGNRFSSDSILEAAVGGYPQIGTNIKFVKNLCHLHFDADTSPDTLEGFACCDVIAG